MLCTVLFGVSEGGIPFLIQYILDGIFANKNESLLLWLPIIIVAFALFRAFFDFSHQYLMARIGHRIVRDLRNALNAHFLKLSPSYFVQQAIGNLLSRVTSDVMLVKTLLTDSVSSLVRDSIRVIALLTAALILDPVLTGIAFLAFPLAVYPIMRFGKRMRKLSRSGQDSIGLISNRLQESILGNKVVKICGREDFEIDRFERDNEELTRTFVKSEKVRALTGPVNEILGALAIAGVIVYGGMSVIYGTRSQGDFIAFLASVFLLYEPFKKLSKLHTSMQQGFSGADRVFEILDTELDIEEPENPRKLPERRDIRFEEVSFRYPGSEEEALSGVSIVVEEGKMTALVGLSGAGKSTLVDLIPRFIDPTSGVVRIGGEDLRTLSLAAIRQQIAMVGQHTFLFHDTVRSNIAYGRPDATDEEIEAAAVAAHAGAFIKRLPNGLETQLGEGGHSLSGGERQRIAIARAILKDAPILILDEATASLDNQSEREVQLALQALERERTSVVIAHRLSTIQRADKIVVLKEGRVVEEGTHQELLARGEEYSRLYQLQFQDDEASSPSESVIH